MSWYRKKEWREFRDQIIEFDGFKCVRCDLLKSDGATLQVHHKRYLKGKKPWEHPPEDCETLCKRCHAEQHALIFPKFEWICIGEDDLGDLSGNCDVCGTQLRYVFTISNDKWFDLEVGTDCCDSMTGTKTAGESQKLRNRKKRFVKSPRWKSTLNGAIINLEKWEVSVLKNDNSFRILINGHKGKKIFFTQNEARELVFEIWNNGKLGEYLKKVK